MTSVSDSADDVEMSEREDARGEGAATAADTSASAQPTTAASQAPSSTTGRTSTVTVPPPSLNVYKKVAVIRRSDDKLQYEDATGNLKTVSIQELGDAISKAVSLNSSAVTGRLATPCDCI